ncbi:MAG: hypothetical protein KKD63_05665 [Proteobacteria bacterium]|nr:hypothetical protein [Desulfobulbaceae bacterium]MBU4152347.1 hypothetical protein [Pseudomonadota bacterium]
MISHCPHCQASLQFSPAQQEKIDLALANLKTGALRLGCPHCKAAISLKADGTLWEESVETSPKEDAVVPPAFPDISWLAQSIYSEMEFVADVPKALVLMNESEGRRAVAKTLTDRGYQLEFPESANDALVQMRFGSFQAVVLHDEFDGPLAGSVFHRQMAEMPMDRRRGIIYALIGKKFHTLYRLEALSYSANIVVNEGEAVHFDIIFQKGLQEKQELFDPYLEALKEAAKSK